MQQSELESSGDSHASEVTQFPIVAETLAVLEIWYDRLMLRLLRPFSSYAACPCTLSLLARKLETLAFAGVQYLCIGARFVARQTWLFHTTCLMVNPLPLKTLIMPKHRTYADQSVFRLPSEL